MIVRPIIVMKFGVPKENRLPLCIMSKGESKLRREQGKCHNIYVSSAGLTTSQEYGHG
jgi:hypothetical protein